MEPNILGWATLGVIVLGNFWICISVILNILRKLDRLEDKLVAMTEAYPHQALIQLQREGIAAQQRAFEASQGSVTHAPDWSMQEAS